MIELRRTFIAALVAATLAAPAARADVPQTLTVQGVLRDAQGQVVTGNVSITVAFYDASTSGSMLAGPFGPVTVQARNGLFSTVVGDQTLRTRLAGAHDVWMEVSQGESAYPRQQVTSQVFALVAAQAETLSSSCNGCVKDAMIGGVAGEKVNGKVATAALADTATATLNGVVTTAAYTDPAWIVSLGGSKIVGPVDSAGSATSFTGALTGDVSGTQAETHVTAIRGTPIANVAPADGQLLVYNGASGQWGPGGVQVRNSMLENSSLTIDAGPGLAGGGNVALGGNVSIPIAPGGITADMVAGGSLTSTNLAQLAGITDAQVNDDVTAGRAQNLTEGGVCDNTRGGAFYYNTYDSIIYYCNGSEWQALALGSTLNGASQGVWNAVMDETARAQAAEAALRASIDGNYASATRYADALAASQQSALQSAVAALEGSIESEIAARKQGDADTLSAANVYADGLNATEAARAQVAEASLQQAIDAEAAARKQAVTDAVNDANHYAEIQVAVESQRAQSAESAVQSNLASLGSSLIAEESRAQSAEAGLSAAIAGEVQRAVGMETAMQTVVSGLDSSLSMEQSRAQATEAAIISSLQQETSDRAAAESGFDTRITAVNDALAAYQAQLKQTGTINANENPVEWTQLKGVPAAIAAGGYAPGVGIRISGGVITSTGIVKLNGVSPDALGGFAVTGSGGVTIAQGQSGITIGLGAISASAITGGDFTINTGTGLSGGGTVELGGALTLVNTGVTGLAGGGGVTVSASSGSVTLGTHAGGDLTGSLATALVAGIQGRPVSSAAPSAGDLFAWNGAMWAPAAAASVNPMPRSCAAGQVAISTGPNGWACGVLCATGTADCNHNPNDGCEVAVATDRNNCSACGVACSSNNIAAPSCSQGNCNGACNPGFADCNGDKQIDGCETNVNTDAANCGLCGQSCSNNNMAAVACNAGSCQAGTCAAGFADCNNNKQADGCEVALNGDASNCGGCGLACSTNNVTSRVCSGGNCQASLCAAGFADCNNNKQVDGCEINVNTDADHCGGCGAACSASGMSTRGCSAGSCQGGTCAAGYRDCNGDKRSDGCEVNINTDSNNCGGCGVLCNGTCTNGACITSGTHLLFANGPGYACPTGATSFEYTGALNPNSQAQALAACEACYGAGNCYVESADSSGLAYGPRPAGDFVCGEVYFGWQSSDNGTSGRAWPICDSIDSTGYWGRF